MMRALLPIVLALLLVAREGGGAPVEPIRIAGAAGPSGAVVTHVRLSGTASSAQRRVPVSLGQVFAAGDVPGGQQLRATIAETGERVTLQLDRKARRADGSLRHAVLSVILPAVPIGSPQTPRPPDVDTPALSARTSRAGA